VHVLDRNRLPIGRDLQNPHVGVGAAQGETAVAAGAARGRRIAEQQARHLEGGGVLPDVGWAGHEVRMGPGRSLNLPGDGVERPLMADDLGDDGVGEGAHDRFYQEQGREEGGAGITRTIPLLPARRRMTVRPGKIDGLFIIERDTFEDFRGFFRETFRMSELAEALGHVPTFVQENHSRSRKGVLRGLHAENWEKLIYVPHGRVFTAVADIRPDSRTFGVVETFELGRWGDASEAPELELGQTRAQKQDATLLKVYLPRAVAHGFCVLSDEAEYVYQVTEYFQGAPTPAVIWNDPDLAIPWPLSDPILSPQDQGNLTLRSIRPERFRS
jgi:dTDP-4-dehydrorhamnose 3,5-epimerase